MLSRWDRLFGFRVLLDLYNVFFLYVNEFVLYWLREGWLLLVLDVEVGMVCMYIVEEFMI